MKQEKLKKLLEKNIYLHERIEKHICSWSMIDPRKVLELLRESVKNNIELVNLGYEHSDETTEDRDLDYLVSKIIEGE